MELSGVFDSDAVSTHGRGNLLEEFMVFQAVHTLIHGFPHVASIVLGGPLEATPEFSLRKRNDQIRTKREDVLTLPDIYTPIDKTSLNYNSGET